MQLALEVKSRFLAIMSHGNLYIYNYGNVLPEIRTPLSGIVGSMNLLAETQLDTDQQDVLHTAQGNGYF